jgi:hypothetical protein
MQLLESSFRVMMHTEHIDVFRLLLADPVYLAFLRALPLFTSHQSQITIHAFRSLASRTKDYQCPFSHSLKNSTNSALATTT